VVTVFCFQKYPNTRPIILAPKIMLQPWAKEFLKWNVNIPVYNFNQAGEQGRILHQKHVDAGIVRLNPSGKSQGKKLLVRREVFKYLTLLIALLMCCSCPALA